VALGGRLGVDWVGLAQAAAGPAVGSVNLDDLQAIGAHKPGQPGSVGAGAFDADLGHRPQALCPVDQRHITAGRGRKRGTAKDAAGLVDDRRHMAVGMGVDPDRDRSWPGWHASHRGSFRLDRTGTARTCLDGGQHCDGGLCPGSYQVTSPTGGCLGGLRRLADKSRARHMAGKKSGQTNRRGRTHPDHRSKTFPYHLKAGPAAGPAAAVLAPATTRRPPGHRLIFT
jgi:hypothetical protein